MRSCRVNGCRRSAEGHGRYCNKHKSHDRRHGHPEQRPVTVFELRHHKAACKAFLNRRANHDHLWANLRGAWRALVETAKAEVRAVERGEVHQTFKLAAFKDILRVAGGAEPDEVVLALCGMGHLWTEQPHRFRSDRAWFQQLARRFRGLTDTHVAKYQNAKTGKVHRVYAEPGPRAASYLGQLLAQSALVSSGASIAMAAARQEERAEEAKASTLRKLMAAAEASGQLDDPA
jgi:hypothetical protein